MRKLNIHAIAKGINTLCKGLDAKYNINFGGCCFVASEIAKHFDRLGLKYELRIYDNCGKDLIAINNEIRNKHRNNSGSTSVVGCYTCSHYFIWLEGAGGINEIKEDFEGWPAYTIRNVTYTNIKWVYKVGSWNDCYDKSNNQKY